MTEAAAETAAARELALTAEERSLLAAVPAGGGPTEPPTAEPEPGERYARVVWSRLAEPGDGVAGLLIGALGASGALRAVIRAGGPGELAERLSDVPETRRELRRRLGPALERWRPRLSRNETAGDLRRAASAGLCTVAPGDALWPAQLDDLGVHAPALLWCRGEPALLRTRSLAVVGSRAASAYGEHVTGVLTEAAVLEGVTIVSGAAYGIDGVAHRTALACEGPTIAVLAGGADRSYPRGHEDLLTRIRERGLVCSELVPGQAPTRWRFLQRNRIIAALGVATLVCEAGRRSGSLNTAGHAAELGRPLGAVPGPITSVGSAGCHRLFRERGAEVIGGVPDLRELLGAGRDVAAEAGEDDPAAPMSASAEQRRVLDAMPGRGVADALGLARRSGLSPAEVARTAAELVTLGELVAHQRGWQLR